ncbi:MAG: hypothetical protein ABJZ55_15220 [Fuerstiella sp.]
MKSCIAALAILAITISIGDLAMAQSETVATAAKKAFDQGEIERTGGNHTGAVTLLKTAVRIAPDNALYHHRLAKACLDAKKFDAMWIHYRRAAFLEYANEEYARDFMNVWMYHDRQGALNCGVSSAEVLKKLGEPDKRVESDRMKRWVYGFVAVDFGQEKIFSVLDLRGYTAEAAAEPEQVKVQTDPKYWQVSHHAISRRDDNLELTPHGEKVQNWKELFSKQRFPLMSRTSATVRGMADSMRASLEKSAGFASFDVLSESPETIVYHWRTKHAAGRPPQHEIAKIIKGEKDFYRVAYVKKTEELTQDEFEKWSKVIGEATLIPRTVNSNVNVSTAESNKPNARLASWELGKNLAFAALLRGRHGPDEIVKQTLLRVSGNSQILGVTVPAPGPLTDDVSADTASAIQFLLNTAGKPIYNSLQEKHGDASSALFELGTKSTLLSMLYQPGDSTSESFASAIERAALKAQVDPTIWKSLVTLVSGKAPVTEVRAEIKRFQKQMSSL